MSCEDDSLKILDSCGIFYLKIAICVVMELYHYWGLSENYVSDLSWKLLEKKLLVTREFALHK